MQWTCFAIIIFCLKNRELSKPFFSKQRFRTKQVYALSPSIRIGLMHVFDYISCEIVFWLKDRFMLLSTDYMFCIFCKDISDVWFQMYKLTECPPSVLLSFSKRLFQNKLKFARSSFYVSDLFSYQFIWNFKGKSCSDIYFFLIQLYASQMDRLISNETYRY